MKTGVALALLSLSLSASSIPFSGPGVNTHGQFLPISAMRAIGIRWVRCDVGVNEMNSDRVREVVRYYRDAGMPQLWILPQSMPDPIQSARDFVHWGITDVEVSNEPDLAAFNPDHQPWSPSRYGQFFAEIYSVIHPYVRLYGPCTSTWNPQYISEAMHAGMKPDGVSYHGYHVNGMARVSDSIRSRWGVPAIMSEVAAEGGADPASSYITWKRQMGNRPWVYYDGPETDDRGLFAHSGGYTWDRPTSVYNRIHSALSG